MTRSDERRLGKIEGALSPKEAFLLWMGEAHEHQSWAGYVMSLKDQPIEQHPLRRLPKQLEQAVREAHKGEEGLVNPLASYGARTSQKAQREQRIESEVIRAVREVSFYYELHEALTSRLALEWKAMALQPLVAIGQARRLMEDKDPKQEEIDQTRHWVVQALGDLLLWQRAATLVSERYLDGRCGLFPHQERRLQESIEHAEHVVTLVNDHLDWLQYLQEHKQGDEPGPCLDLEPVDLGELRSVVEREATPMVQQMVDMAKAEAALFVHEPKLATDLLGRVWVGLN